MSKLCMSSKTKKSQFSGHFISDFVMLFHSILSHPLYFSYFVFFSPYLLKLLSFLSPLFVTTSLLFIAFNLVNESSSSQLQESKKGFLVFFVDILEKLKSKADNGYEELNRFEEFELYKIVFDVSVYEVSELNCEEKCIEAIESTVIECINECLDDEVSQSSCEEKSIEVIETKVDENHEAVSQPFVKAMMFWQEKSNFDYVLCDKDEKDINADFNKVEIREENSSIRSGSKILNSEVSIGNNEELTTKVVEESQGQEVYLQKSDNVENHGSQLGKEDSRNSGANFGIHMNDEDFDEDFNGSFSPNFSSYGSVRKEKEWRRTLACKLFEERHSVQVGGTEGMDLLWETYESKESVKVKTKGNAKKGKSHYRDEDDEEEDEDINGELCCLQALKFSAGKMHLGIGRPNIVKISKAFKGIGWLQSMSRRSKKNCQ